MGAYEGIRRRTAREVNGKILEAIAVLLIGYVFCGDGGHSIANVWACDACSLPLYALVHGGDERQVLLFLEGEMTHNLQLCKWW